MIKLYVCNRENEKTRWLEVYADTKKEISDLCKALKPYGWKKSRINAFENVKMTFPGDLPSADDMISSDEPTDFDSMPRYWTATIEGPEGSGLFNSWTPAEARKNNRNLKKVLTDMGNVSAWEWEKTLADML